MNQAGPVQDLIGVKVGNARAAASRIEGRAPETTHIDTTL